MTKTFHQSIVSSPDEAQETNYVNKYQKVYFQCFLIALLFCWSPSKFLAYLAPWGALAWFFVATRSRRLAYNLFFVLSIWLLIVPVYVLLTPRFTLHSAMLSLLTYGSFIFFVVIPTKYIAGRHLTARMLSIARWVVLFEGSWGIVQGVLSALHKGTFDGSTGDAVAGTIRPFAVVSDFSNFMFAVNMALFLILLLPSLTLQRKGKFIYIIGVVSLILASVLHVLLFLAVAVGMAFIFYYPSFFRSRRGCLIVIGFFVAAFLALNLLSGNLSSLRSFASHTLSGGTPRAQVVIRVFSRMPVEYPWMPLIGLGPGQFSSRAGLIGTGMYFGSPANPKSIPLLPKGMSEPFRKYVLDLWLSLFWDRSGNYVFTGNNTSTTYFPYFSWLSIYTEFGLVGFGIILHYLARFLFTLKKRIHTSFQRLTAASLGTGFLLIFIIGLQENYWEVSQAIFVGIILLKALYANFIYKQDIIES